MKRVVTENSRRVKEIIRVYAENSRILAEHSLILQTLQVGRARDGDNCVGGGGDAYCGGVAFVTPPDTGLSSTEAAETVVDKVTSPGTEAAETVVDKVTSPGTEAGLSGTEAAETVVDKVTTPPAIEAATDSTCRIPVPSATDDIFHSARLEVFRKNTKRKLEG